MSLDEPLRAPIGCLADSHSTRPGARRVLLIVHNVTSLTRLLELIPLLEDEHEVTTLATQANQSAFLDGVGGLLEEKGIRTAPWSQALTEKFDLAIAASLGDDLHRINAPLIVLPHGVGYNKRGAPGVPSADGTYGLSRESLTRDGHLVPHTLVLSHPEQRTRLSVACPEALPATLVAGDPVLDRIRAGLPFRTDYRRAMETGSRRLVVVSSTWGPASLVGLRPELASLLLAQLPQDEFQVVLAVHPNVWEAHGEWQVRSWFAAAERAGLRILPPLAGWQAALVAADHVVGDHGSLTGYAAAAGTHTMLGVFAHGELAPDSPMAALGRLAPVLRSGVSLREQLAADAAVHHPDRYRPATELLAACPGQSLAVLRETFYRLLELPEPGTEPTIVPPERPKPYTLRWPAVGHHPPLRVTVARDGDQIAVERFPEELSTLNSEWRASAGTHVVVANDEPQRSWLESAHMVTCANDSEDDPWARLADALTVHDSAGAAATTQGHACLVLTRAGHRVRLSAPGLTDPLVLASACWPLGGVALVPEHFVLILGEREYPARCAVEVALP